MRDVPVELSQKLINLQATLGRIEELIYTKKIKLEQVAQLIMEMNNVKGDLVDFWRKANRNDWGEKV